MPISINGTGTITGISAGGLPDGSIVADDLASNAVTTAKVNDAAITYAKLSTSATESDNVAKRTAKAWVNFNGTGTVAIRDDFNVSSITDIGAAKYTVNFSTAMGNANYCAIVGIGETNYGQPAISSITSGSVQVYHSPDYSLTDTDTAIVCVSVFSS